ncbi:murein transglycosylase A [Chelativorans alearense]|uniref:murein transglycosylase A n=1 Tax=Chelativorans alearense TaxID=2681495 RepID=UPI0013D23DBE|nr:murein transglycosylase A [Chelativorans alearense]
MSLSAVFSPVSYSDLPGWGDDGASAAFAAFARCARYTETRPYRTGSLGVAAEAFADAYAHARNTLQPANAAARAFFEQHFLPFRIRPETAGSGFVTGYYEPETEASPVRTGRFCVPLYRRPDDLVAVDRQNRPAALDPSFAFARRDGKRLLAYHDRQAIDRGALAGLGLELCWLADRVEAFFIHVQGAARLKMTDGSRKRVSYAAKTGHPFTGIGRVLASLGEVPLEEVTMQSIRAWLAGNPRRMDEILWHNRSYIFFRETPVGDPALGPVAAAKVQLEPGHSIAVDRLLHTFGTPFFIDAPSLREGFDKPFRRLMIAQDTGSAITGPARGDLFIGTGKAAGAVAGKIRHPADFYALLPRALAEGRRP